MFGTGRIESPRRQGFTALAVATALTAVAIGAVWPGEHVWARAGVPGREQPEVVLSDLAKAELAEREPGSTVVESHPASGAIVAVTVEPGPLLVMRAPQTVSLTRVPGTNRLRGHVAGVRVVDARSGGAGWQLAIQVTVRGTRGSARTLVGVDRVEAMAMSTEGIRAQRRARVRPPAPTAIVGAAGESRRGAFDVWLNVEIRAPRGSPDRLTGTLEFDVS